MGVVLEVHPQVGEARTASLITPSLPGPIASRRTNSQQVPDGRAHHQSC